VSDEIKWIELNLIDMPARGRAHNPGRVAELARDMAKNGQLQDIVVTPKDGRFEVVAGRGRYLAAKQLNWDKVQALVKDNLSELDKVLLMIAENDEREDVSPIDRGLSYIWAMDTGGLTQESLAGKVGKTQGYIAQYITAARLPEPVREIITRVIIDIAHIRQIARLPSPEAQLAMAQRCEKEDLTVKQLENLIQKALTASASPSAAPVTHSPLAGEGGPASSAGKDEGANAALKPGFKIAKSAKGIRVAGDFPDNITLPELAKALEEPFQKWQADRAKGQTGVKQPKPKQAPKVSKAPAATHAPAQPTIPTKAQMLAGLRNVKEAMDASAASAPKADAQAGPKAAAGFGAAELNEMKEQQKNMFSGLKESLSTPDGRAMIEQVAKAQGFQTPEEYIASVEETLKKQGLS